jgi:hypothetical protein
MTCFSWLLVLVGGILFILSLLRWFEQVTEAVRNRWWNKTLLLVIFPFSVWFFRSRVAAGRPTPVPHHEPVRGFGSVPKERPLTAQAPASPTLPVSAKPPSAEPPPGTPAEFLVKPVPVKRPKSGAAVDPEKLAKLKAKMREQGMLGDDQ